MKKQSLLFGLPLFVVVFLISCKKETGGNAMIFHGQWKTSYGDTVLFARVNGKNMVGYDLSMSPAVPAGNSYEYAYLNGKLGIKNGLAGTGNFYFFQTFKWLDEGRSFELQGVEWFPFMSSTITYFTFTKIN